MHNDISLNVEHWHYGPIKIYRVGRAIHCFQNSQLKHTERHESILDARTAFALYMIEFEDVVFDTIEQSLRIHDPRFLARIFARLMLNCRTK